MQRLHVRGSEDTQLAKFLHSRVVGQEQAVASIVAQYDKLMAGMADPTRPVASMLFLGPTGVGKTKVVEAFTEYLFGEGQRPLKVNCGEYTHDHQVAKLIGSPAGYMGSNEEPYFSKQRVEQRRTKDGRQLNVVLFDEIEKAGSAEGRKGQGAGALSSLMLSVLDRGELNLSHGPRVDFSQTIIFMTSNLGAEKLIEAQSDESKMRAVAEESARRFFSPEQFNRIDELVVFKTLDPAQITLIADLEVTEVANRARMELELDDKVRDGLVRMGYDVRYGARQLKRVVDRHITRPVSALMASRQARAGDRLRVEVEENGSLAFFKMEGQAQVEEVKQEVPVAARPEAPELKYRSDGYVRRMLDRKFKYGESHGAKAYKVIKAMDFKPATAEQVTTVLEKQGWSCNNAGGNLAAIKYVLHDWVKKGWAERDYADRYVVKE